METGRVATGQARSRVQWKCFSVEVVARIAR